MNTTIKKQKELFELKDRYSTDSFLSSQRNLFERIENNKPINHISNYENLVNFHNAASTPIQRWFSYREGYSSEIVTNFIKEKNITGTVFDPFAGSGSTLLSARLNDLPSIGIDINPYSSLIALVSNQFYNEDEKKLILQLKDHFKSLQKKDSDRNINFNLINKAFNNSILNSLLCIRDEIDNIENIKVKNLFFATWLSIIEDVSNTKKEGNGIKYLFTKRTKDGYINLDQQEWEQEYFPINKFNFVKNAFAKKLNIIINDILNCYGSIKFEPKIKTGNCLKLDYNTFDDFNLTYFSPPYCNAFDYFEIYKIELWMGEFVKNRKELLELKRAGFRSNLTSLSRKKIKYTNKNIKDLIGLLNTRNHWDKRLPNVVAGYFDDMHTLLKRLYNKTKKNGYVVIVVGNSAYSGCIIPTDIIISDIAQKIGFDISNIAITRHLTTSSQQKKYLEPINEYLRESIVVLKR